MECTGRFGRFVAVLAAAVALAGCVSGSPTPNRSSVTAGPASQSGSSSSPSTSPSVTVPAIPADVPKTGHNVRPGEKPPEYPVTALDSTQDGANAFAEFFMRTLDWAYATTNPSYMKHYYGSTCGLCDGLATGMAKTAAAGHRYEGGRFQLRTVVPAQIAPVTAPADYCSLLSLNEAAVSVVDNQGNIINGDGAHAQDELKICVKGVPGAWRTTYMAFIS